MTVSSVALLCLFLAVVSGAFGFGVGMAWFGSRGYGVRIEHRREMLRLQRQHEAWTREQSRIELARHKERLEAALDAEAGVDTTTSELRGVL